MTPVGFWWWAAVWLTGWSLWLFGGRELHAISLVVLLGVAPWVAGSLRGIGRDASRADVIISAISLLLAALVLVVGLWSRGLWSAESLPARSVCLVVVAFGVAANAWRTFGRVHRAA